MLKKSQGEKGEATGRKEEKEKERGEGKEKRARERGKGRANEYIRRVAICLFKCLSGKKSTQLPQ